jgi:Fur family ferric uptake transcriptional regulator
LADKNLAIKFNIMGDDRTLFEYNRMVHRHYLICMGCKKILAINRCPLEDYEKSLAKETNYSIAGHKLDIYGYCPKCRKKD